MCYNGIMKNRLEDRKVSGPFILPEGCGMYYNAEHYHDPTAGAAIARVRREEKKRERHRMTQKEFYRSAAWRRVRDAYISRRKAIDGGICESCHDELGLIVHHVIWLDDNNCNDPSISLNPDNFRYECQTCHNKEKDPRHKAPGRVAYGPNGEILRPQ